jgi:hypothetical protein
MSETDNPPYEPPVGHADAPPPVPPEPEPDPETQAYLDGFVAAPDPRDPDAAPVDPGEYQDGFVKPPDPRDPETSDLTPGDLNPPSEPGDGVSGTAPVNVDVPYVSQDGAALNCTMGNWEGEPTTYAYQWQAEGVDVGDDTATHALVESDIGLAFVCVVSATNAAGTTTAPPSNMVTAVEAATRSNHRGRRKAEHGEDPS